MDRYVQGNDKEIMVSHPGSGIHVWGTESGRTARAKAAALLKMLPRLQWAYRRT